MAVLYKILNGKEIEVNDHMVVTYNAFGIKSLTDIGPELKVKKVVKKKAVKKKE